MSFRKQFLKNILISGGYNYLSQAISFLSTIIVSRLLPPETYGLVNIIIIFTGFLTIFSDSGITLAIIRSDFLYTYHKSVDTLALFIGTILCLATCLIAYPVSVFFKAPILLFPMMVMSLSFIFKSMTLVRSALIARNMNFNFAGKVTLLTNVFQVSLTIILAYLGGSYWALVIPQTLSGLITLLIQERKIKFGFHLYSLAHMKVSYKYTKKTIGNLMGFNVVNYWSRNSDNLLVGRIYGTADLGIYARAYNLLTFPLAIITGLIGAVLYPSLNKIKSSEEAVRKEYLFVLKLIGFLSFPVSAILLLFPEKLVSILWGNKWLGVAQFLPYFGLLLLSQSLLSTVGNILVLVKREEVLRISGWLSALAIITGIAIGSTISLVAIAQCYSLAFIILVLPMQLFYVYVKTLRFSLRQMLLFWGTKILFSLAIWLACFFHMDVLKIVLLVLFFFTMLWDAKEEIGKLITMVNNNFIKNENRGIQP